MLLLFLIVWLATHRPKWFMPFAKRIAKFNGKAMKGQSSISALAVCFAAAALAGAYGLSAAYGAFLAGLALGQTRQREKLHKRTQPIFDVLIMVFFLSVGLLIDLHFVAKHWVTVAELVGAIMLIKTLVNFITLRSQGIKSKDAFLIGAITGQIGEFSFLLAGTGLSDKSLDENTYRYVVSVVSLSLMLTPIWLLLLQKLKLMSKIKPSATGEKIEQIARTVY
jgi:CPA2 family monovalent cation:H+ antiporter-2